MQVSINMDPKIMQYSITRDLNFNPPGSGESRTPAGPPSRAVAAEGDAKEGAAVRPSPRTADFFDARPARPF
jgi:hypothetical protein